MKKVIFVVSALFLVLLLAGCLTSTTAKEGVFYTTQALYMGPIPIEISSEEVGIFELTKTDSELKLKYTMTATKTSWVINMIYEKVTGGVIPYELGPQWVNPASAMFEDTIDLNALGVVPGTILTFHIKIGLLEGGCNPYSYIIDFTYEVPNGGGGAAPKAVVTAVPYRERTIEYDWELTKEVDPLDCLELQQGETGVATFTLKATRTEVSIAEDFYVKGEVEVYSEDSSLTISAMVINLFEDDTFVASTTVDYSATPTLEEDEHGFYPYNWNLIGINPDATHTVRADVVTDIGPADAISDIFDFTNITSIGEYDEEAYLDDAIDDFYKGLFDITTPGYPSFPITLTETSVLYYVVEITAEECEESGWITNNATLTESYWGTTHLASATLCFYSTECDGDLGCVLTQGYWKNHTEEWGVEYSPDATFFYSSKTWIEILNTPNGETRADAYIILAKQYIAARLNEANGAAVPTDVATALSSSEAWFETNSPGVDPNSVVGQMLLEWKDVLDTYNNGWNYPSEPGWPPHCDDVEDYD